MTGSATLLARLLAHPATRGLDLDAPATTSLRRDIVRGKPFLRSIYEEWYRLIAARIPSPPGDVLELGSGAGFMAEFVPGLVTSDVFAVPGVKRVVDARDLPFADDALRGIVMTNVLHHVPQVERFLGEAQRCLRPGGRLVMVEPWNTCWGRLVYRRLHHEPFDPAAPDWSIPDAGPLSGANGALPWIIAQRDRARLQRDFPSLRVIEIRPMMPLRYLLSGGVSMRSLQPGWLHGAWRIVERPLERWAGMFALIAIERR